MHLRSVNAEFHFTQGNENRGFWYWPGILDLFSIDSKGRL